MLAKIYAGVDTRTLDAASLIVSGALGPEGNSKIREAINSDPAVSAAQAEIDRVSSAIRDHRSRNPSPADALFEALDDLTEQFGDLAAELALTPANSPLEMLQKAEILAIVLADSDITPADILDRVRFDVEAITGERYSPLPHSVRLERKYRPAAGLSSKA